MFAKLHLLSQDVPEGGDGFRWRAHPYLRMAGSVPKGPVVFDWSARQRTDLEALWRDPTADGARERLAKDLAVFCEKLGWAPDGEQLAETEKHGDEYMLTVSAVPSELYMLPWEVIQVGAEGTYMSDYGSAQVRYAMPGLGPRELETPPAEPGVLFAWSAAGGAVPHEEQAAAIRAAAEAGGVSFRELAEVNEASLQAALDDGAPSVLHLLCHGLPGAEGEPSRLRWGPSDRPSEITGPRLARMLRTQDGIRLVVLSTCGGGDGHGDPMLLGSLAQELHRKGIPSVVASRYPLSVPGSRMMTRALYDKLLREAWSLERALRFTRQALFRVDEDGEAHPGDAYGIQLYAYDTEWFVSDNEVEAERPVLASYPFGTPARPVPASAPPPAELTLSLAERPGLSGDELVDRLRRVAEDGGLVVVIQQSAGKGPISLVVHTTVDGAQRLLGAWRSKALQIAVGVIVGALVLTKGIATAFGATLAASVGQAAGHVGAAVGHIGGAAAAHAGAAVGHIGAAAGHIGAAAGHGGIAAGQAGAAVGQAGVAAGGAAAGQAGAAAGQAGVAAGGAAAGQAGAAAGQAGVAAGGAAAGQAGAAAGGAAAGQAVAAGAGKAAAVLAFAGKAVTAKFVLAALVSSAAVAGGAALYHVQSRPAVSAPATPERPESSPSPHPKSISTDVSSPSDAGTLNTGLAQGGVDGGGSMDNAAVPTGGPGGSVGDGPGNADVRTADGGVGGTSADPNGTPHGDDGDHVPGGGGRIDAGVGGNPDDSPHGSRDAGAMGKVSSMGDGGVPVRGDLIGHEDAGHGETPMGSGSGSESGPGSGGVPGDTTADPLSDGPDPATATDAAAAPAVCGNHIQEAGEQCDDGNTSDGDGCSSQCMREIAIAPEVLMAQLKTGNRDVDPSEETKASVKRHPEEGLSGTVAVCVNTAGTVTKAAIRDGSGYEEYDNKLVAVVRLWRYRPYLNSGKPAPVCSTVVFVYHSPKQ